MNNDYNHFLRLVSGFWGFWPSPTPSGVQIRPVDPSPGSVTPSLVTPQMAFRPLFKLFGIPWEPSIRSCPSHALYGLSRGLPAPFSFPSSPEGALMAFKTPLRPSSLPLPSLPPQDPSLSFPPLLGKRSVSLLAPHPFAFSEPPFRPF